MEEIKLNLACGNRALEGYVNVDISPAAQADQVTDLTKFPLPWANSSISEINISHFLEHLGDEFIPFMNECYRILKPGGLFKIEGPYYTSVRCWQDPTHKRALSETLFLYFSKDWRILNGLQHYPITTDFKLLDVKYLMGEEMREIETDQLEWLRHHAVNIVQDFRLTLEATKPESQIQVVN